MNGVHDMGGMHGLGAIVPELDEPVFHAPWEARVFALRRAMGAWRKWNIDATRHAVEKVPAAQYLALDYFSRQFEAFLAMLVGAGFVTQDEIGTGRTQSKAAAATPALTLEKAALLVSAGVHCDRQIEVQA